MRIRLVREVDFRAGEHKNYEDAVKEAVKGSGVRLGKDDVVALLSITRHCIYFVSGYTTFNSDERSYKALASVKVRIDGKWTPRKLADYAAESGLNITNLNGFAAVYDEIESEAITRRAYARRVREAAAPVVRTKRRKAKKAAT